MAFYSHVLVKIPVILILTSNRRSKDVIPSVDRPNIFMLSTGNTISKSISNKYWISLLKFHKKKQKNRDLTGNLKKKKNTTRVRFLQNIYFIYSCLFQEDCASQVQELFALFAHRMLLNFAGLSPRERVHEQHIFRYLVPGKLEL